MMEKEVKMVYSYCAVMFVAPAPPLAAPRSCCSLSLMCLIVQGELLKPDTTGAAMEVDAVTDTTTDKVCYEIERLERAV